MYVGNGGATKWSSSYPQEQTCQTGAKYCVQNMVSTPGGSTAMAQQCATSMHAQLCDLYYNGGASGSKGCVDKNTGMKVRCIKSDPGTMATPADFKAVFSGAPACQMPGGRRSSDGADLKVSVTTYSDAKAKEGDAALTTAVQDASFAGKISAAIPGASISGVELKSHSVDNNNAVTAPGGGGGESDGGSNTGLIVGLVILFIVLLACAAGAAYYFMVVKKKSALSNQDGNDTKHVELEEAEEGGASKDAPGKYPGSVPNTGA